VKKGTMLCAAFASAAIALTVATGTVYAGTAGRAHRGAIPVTASMTTPTGSSMLIPMGHLSDPSNTFWELFLRRPAGTSWVLATPPGVATNGGLVAAVPPVGSLTVGFLISAALKFSPVAQSTNGGKTWSPGDLPSPLTATPDSLAVGPTGETLALVAKAGQSILTKTVDLSTWRTLTTTKVLARATSTCAWQRVTAVAYTAASQPLLGLACARAGEIGILGLGPSSAMKTSGWHNVGPSLPPATGIASVVRLERTAAGPVGLAQLESAKRTSLVAFWAQGATDQWLRSAALPVPTGWAIDATATGGGAGQDVAVLLRSRDQSRVEVITGPGSSWVTVAGSPRRATGVSDIGTEIDTFVVMGNHLAVWAWTPGSVAWRRTSTIRVPVPYGSSS
jgi:hypothetical protein